MTVITLITDFGEKDGYAGVMKGVILSIAPQVQIADITHQVSPQNVLEGALVLGRVARYFPPGTIHLAVVDPGVGTQRRPIIARLGEQFFVGPDNGLCSLLLEQVRRSGQHEQFIHLDRPHYWLPEISHVFHGRDIFSPVAAHVANGASLTELGSPIHDPCLLEYPHPQRIEDGWNGMVMHVDSFGNLSTNLERRHIPPGRPVRIQIGGIIIDRLVTTYGDAAADQLVALFDSSGKLSVCVVNGSAAERLQVTTGDLVMVTSY
jgi:S-adenosyl-L-methionine hydrolase (adenosine-forming)